MLFHPRTSLNRYVTDINWWMTRCILQLPSCLSILIVITPEVKEKKILISGTISFKTLHTMLIIINDVRRNGNKIKTQDHSPVLNWLSAASCFAAVWASSISLPWPTIRVGRTFDVEYPKWYPMKSYRARVANRVLASTMPVNKSKMFPLWLSENSLKGRI